MDKKTIDGNIYSQMIAGGASVLGSHSGEVDDLNVFPIPDGDTGTNMLQTIEGGAQAPTAEADIAKESEKIAEAMLLNARGNSGVILSQFFAGIARGLEGVHEADVDALVVAFKSGVESAYKSVFKPTEGTILTVMREATQVAADAGAKTPVEFLDLFIKAAEESLLHTPDLLPVLKKAGVVDSGGAGLIYIIKGMKRALDGESFEQRKQVTEASAELDLDAFDENSVLEFGYCTELLLRLQNAKCVIDTFDVGTIISYLETIGDSIVAVKNGSIVKIHVHTMTPDKVLSFCQSYGEFLKIKIENMSLQHNNTELPSDKDDDAIETHVEKELSELAVVAVANGEGVKEAFIDMSVDVIVDGGQSMNPSTEDFLRAFDEAHARKILVFPNNSNIILAANQAASLYKKAEVRVVNSKTIGDGYAALSMLDSESGDLEEIASACEEAMQGVITAEVSKCVRDAEFDGVNVKTDDYIGFVGKNILSCSENRLEAAKAATDKIELDSHEICIIIRGEDSTDEEAAELEAYVNSKYPRTETFVLEGGQHVYSYIIIAE
ncbi:MAG: DAK2 domain-containing protein [Clostridia bacterium]|nr:DAK2 domain-containing protein [Clostridia bacterium]